MNPTRSEAIKNFLMYKAGKGLAPSDLAQAYHIGMEVQVNVAQDGGERIEGEWEGRKFHAFTDGSQTWKPIRIPYKAYSEPEYTDKPITFDLAAHVEGIGLTGWNWQEKVSEWVGFDFDAIIGHSERHTNKLTSEQLEIVQEAVSKIPWVTLRKSTSGNGLHLYVYVDKVPTKNHGEHQALSRAILGLMSAITGHDFYSQVDICGQVLWVWHRKMDFEGSEGLKLIKKGEVLDQIPPNWRDHIKVVGKRKGIKVNTQDIDSLDQNESMSSFDELCSKYVRIPLDLEHKKLITFLQEHKCVWWWDQDHHMLVSHTLDLAKAHAALQMKGIFRTTSRGSTEHNCFLFPLKRGAWAVRRYGEGVSEDTSWDQDNQGWTRCYLNKETDFKTACRTYGGLEDPKGGVFKFTDCESAIKAAQILGAYVSVPNNMLNRECHLSIHKDGRLIFNVVHTSQDTGMSQWLLKKGEWIKMFQIRNSAQDEEVDLAQIDDAVRHVVCNGKDLGWYLNTDNEWKCEPLTHIKPLLQSLGNSPKEVTAIIGGCVNKPWKIVCKPFEPEYPGNREWNLNAPQLRFNLLNPDDKLHYPTWIRLLNHVGKGLDDAVKDNEWCKTNLILTGADYLKCWIASLFQCPHEPLPYLFLYGPENSGKSLFIKMVKMLMRGGYARGDRALESESGFNFELEGAILAGVEETNVSKGGALNRLKDWVTSPEILVHPKKLTPYLAPNMTHWIQTANDPKYCAVFPGDTRITMFYVSAVAEEDKIPERILMPELEKQAPDFLTAIMNIELPSCTDRLRIPVITTFDKQRLQDENTDELNEFIKQVCEMDDGYKIRFTDFWEKFQLHLSEVNPQLSAFYTKRTTSKNLPSQLPYGRLRSGDQNRYIGNIRWKEGHNVKECSRYVVSHDGHLDPVKEKQG